MLVVKGIHIEQQETQRLAVAEAATIPGTGKDKGVPGLEKEQLSREGSTGKKTSFFLPSDIWYSLVSLVGQFFQKPTLWDSLSRFE